MADIVSIFIKSLSFKNSYSRFKYAKGILLLWNLLKKLVPVALLSALILKGCD